MTYCIRNQMGNACRSAKTVSTSLTINQLPVPIAPKQPSEVPESSIISQLSQSAQDSIIHEIDDQV